MLKRRNNYEKTQIIRFVLEKGENKMFELLELLEKIYQEIDLCKGVQSQQLWSKVSEIKNQIRNLEK